MALPHRDLDTTHISSLQNISESLQQYVKQEIYFLANTNTNWLHLPISVSRTGFMGLYDTGADICCIEEQAFDKIPMH